MEVVLNLAWVLLALPAYWLWRRGAGSRLRHGTGSLQCLLALACVLVLLFPVISASDDLHAMRAEMEDSSISKRAVRQAGTDRHSANRVQGSPALVTAAMRPPVPELQIADVTPPAEAPLARPAAFLRSRAPPFALA